MKKIDAITYTSQAGHSKQYAELLSAKTGIPAVELKAAKKTVSKGAAIIHFGWLLGGQVKGLKKAVNCYELKAVCGVGMSKSGTQIKDMKDKNDIPENTAVFSIQGGFEMEKLSGIYKFMMNTMKKTVGKALQNKTDKTPDEIEMLDMLNSGKNLVSEENLNEIISWINSD